MQKYLQDIYNNKYYFAKDYIVANLKGFYFKGK